MKTARKAKENIRGVRFLLPSGKIEIAGLAAEIAHNFAVIRSSEECEQQTFFDSYDHRCLKKNSILLKCGRVYDLINLKDDSLQFSMVWVEKRELKFSKDIPNPAISKKLSHILDYRAMLPLFTLNVRTHTFRLRSKDQQPLTLTIREFSLTDTKQPLPAIIELSSSQLSRSALKTIGAAIAPEILQESGRTWKALTEAALEVAGINIVPGEAAPIAPESTLKSAATAILKTQLEILRYNEKGISADIDSECLHEFRVALRKTRVALDELQAVFHKNKIDSFLHKFDDLGAITNRLRDYDVFLPQKDHLLKALPPNMRPALLSFFKAQRQRRRRQFLMLVSMINSSAYLSLMASWTKFLEHAEKHPATELSETPILQAVSGIIMKRLNKVIAKGADVKVDSPDTALHKVRIQCKKLRYLLDFFCPVFPGNITAHIVRNLKKVQAVLGDFNDYSVQIRNIDRSLQKLASGKSTVKNAAALGAVITKLSQEKSKKRNQFGKVFNKFSSRTTIAPLESFLKKMKPKCN